MRPNTNGAPLAVAPSIVTQSYSSGRHIDGIDLARNAQSTNNYFKGDIAEVVIFDRELTALERGDVVDHLEQKYGLNLSSDLPIQDGLLLHLDAAKIPGASDGSSIGSWANLVPEGFPATAESGEASPILQTNALSGMPVARFDGTNDWLDIGTLRAAEGALEVLLIVQSTDTGGSTWQRFISAFTSGTNGWSAPNWQVMRPNTNGAPLTVAPSIVTQSYSSGRHIGGIDLARNAQAANRYFAGDIAEVVVFDRQLTAVERKELNYHLARKYSFTLSTYLDPDADSDNDGRTDLDELIAGTRLNDPGHYFSLQASVTGGHFQVSWDSVTEREYVVKRSFDLLLNWEEMGTFIGNDLEKVFEESTGEYPKAFYTIEVTHP